MYLRIGGLLTNLPFGNGATCRREEVRTVLHLSITSVKLILSGFNAVAHRGQVAADAIISSALLDTNENASAADRSTRPGKSWEKEINVDACWEFFDF